MNFFTITNFRLLIRLARTALADLIAPPFCAYCLSMLEQRDVLCSSCQKKITPIVSTTIPVTKTKELKVLAIGNYEGPLRSLILAKKRTDIIASRQLGQLIWDMTYLRNIPFDYVVPIPLHWTRFARRGFNQAEQMARVLAQKSGKPMVNTLKRKKRTRYQAELSRDMRSVNVHDAFVLSCSVQERFKGKHLLLVDDLMTTGSTLKTAAQQLYKLKPASIIVVVACRVV